jgi:hypothetical protein
MYTMYLFLKYCNSVTAYTVYRQTVSLSTEFLLALSFSCYSTQLDAKNNYSFNLQMKHACKEINYSNYLSACKPVMLF